MYFTCTFKNRPRSESARFYAEHKLRNVIRQFADQPIGVKISFQPEGAKEQIHLNLSSGRNFSTTLSASGVGIYEAVDNLAAKLKNCLRKRKNRLKTHSGVDKFDKALFDREQMAGSFTLDDMDAIDAADIINLESRRRPIEAPARLTN